MVGLMKKSMIRTQKRNNHRFEFKKPIAVHLVIALYAIFIFSCGGMTMIGSKHELFDIVEDLTKQRPFNPKKIERILGHVLKNVESESNEFFLTYKSQKNEAQDDDNLAIELRIPTSKSNCTDGMLILDLSLDTCITQDDVMDKYGESEATPPDPDEPTETASFYVSYNYHWGKISYGFMVIGQRCLNSIVLDAIQGE